MSSNYGDLFAAMKPGKPVAICVVCSRVLTDPESIALKMGPECAAKVVAEGAGSVEELNGDGEPSSGG